MRVCVFAMMILMAVVSFADTVPTTQPSTFVAQVLPQARVNVDATGHVVSIFNTTDGSGTPPSIFNVYRGGVNVAITPEIQREIGALKLDWRIGGWIMGGGDI